MYTTKRHGSVTYADGAALSFTFADVGDFQVGALNPQQRALVEVLNRGTFGAWVEGDDIQVSVSFSYHLKGESITSASVARALDAIRFSGTWSAATSTNPGGFGAKVGTLTWSATVNGVTNTIPVLYAALEATANESGNAVVISVSGKGYLGTVTGA